VTLKLFTVIRDPHDCHDGRNLPVKVGVASFCGQKLAMLVTTIAALSYGIQTLQLRQHPFWQLLIDVLVDDLANVWRSLGRAGLA